MRTSAEMCRDVVCQGEDPEGLFLLVKSSDVFPLWFSQSADYVWKYRYEMRETQWLGWWLFKIPIRRRLLLFRPAEVSELGTSQA